MSSPALTSAAPTASAVPARREGQPLLREHGAWVILYAPALIAIVAYGRAALLPSALLLVAITGLFLARNAAGLMLRRRAAPGAAKWLVLYIGYAFAGTGPLLWRYGRWELLEIGALSAALFAAHALLSLMPSRKRMDRSQWAEILAVAALALSAPAAYVAGAGDLDGIAWCLWVACTLYFAGTIFFVKMLLAAARVKGRFGWRERLRIGGGHLTYHLLTIVALVAVSQVQSGVAAVLALLAYLPALVRAFVGWARLSNALPSLKKVGIGETIYAVWFTALFTISLFFAH